MRAFAVSTLALAAMIQAACVGSPAVVEVRLTDHGIEMPRLVPSGPVEFRIANAGTREHNLKIVGGGMEVESAIVEPGQSTTFETTLTTNRFDTFCAVGDHTSKERNEAGVTMTAAPAQ